MSDLPNTWRPTRRDTLIGASALAVSSSVRPAFAQDRLESPFFVSHVANGKLPPLKDRLPKIPRVIDLEDEGNSPGQHGGTMRMLMGDQRDIRMMTIYGYTRLLVFDRNLEIVPDLLAACDVEDGRVFTLKLRPGHRWSDGSPFTTEDFRYWWTHVANNKRLSPGGPPQEMLVRGKPPAVDILSETEIRYAWDEPNPVFLPSLAGAQPNYIFMPSAYLKTFHVDHADKATLAERVRAARVRDWGALHERMSRMYRPENPDLPTLDPWRNTTYMPAEQFRFERNAYFHRIDTNGRQLPYVDEVTLTVGTHSLVPAKAAAGDSDLQARYIRFDNYTFLKDASKRMPFSVKLWKRAEGAYFALMPNLNVIDPVWRTLNHDLRYRRALSVAINRVDINKVIFFGLAKESQNTALPESPLYQERLAKLYTQHDPALANRLLDEIGLTKRDREGVRILSDGRRLEFSVETAGESTEETDILDLMKQDLIEVGIKIYPRSTQRDVFRRRILAGQTVMAASTGFDNALVTAEMEPGALAPTSSAFFQWPRWGQHYETGGREGEAPDLPEAARLLELYREWRRSASHEERLAAWREMLEINAEQLFTIGVVNATLQPVVVSNRLRNVPEQGLYSFEPGAFFGRYMPDTFWFQQQLAKS